MFGALVCLAAMAQAQVPWEAAPGPRGVKAVVVQEPYGKRILLEKAECPAYLRSDASGGKQPHEWRLVRDTDGKASWRKWAAGWEDAVYPRALAATIFPDQGSLAAYAKARADLKPPAGEQDHVFAALSGIPEGELKKDREKKTLYASKVGLEPDDPPILAGAQIPAEVVYVVCGMLVVAGVAWVLIHFKKQEGD